MSIWIYITGIYLFICFCFFIFKRVRYSFFKEVVIDMSYKVIYDSGSISFKWKQIHYFIIAYFLMSLTIILVFITIPIWAIYGKEYKSNNVNIETKLENKLSFDMKYVTPPKFILFSENLLFSPIKQQIIYIENSYLASINDFISVHYEEICTLFINRGYYFCYIPFLNKNIPTYEAIEYYYPNLRKDKIKIEAIKELNYSDLLSNTNEKDILRSGFLRYKSKINNDYQFSYFGLTELTEKELWTQFQTYISQIGDGTKLYSVGKPEVDGIADFNFSYESKQLVKEIKERIERLRQIGINEIAIKSLLLTEPKLSRILITKDFRIFLPDYNNREIVMYPLSKAIFFLFLRHPEGILFKQLPDFKIELKHIYSSLTSRAELKDINESINNVTDPSKNAINEKCSRIREAFIKEFDESLAHYYFITGERAEPKRISIDRGLVTFEYDI